VKKKIILLMCCAVLAFTSGDGFAAIYECDFSQHVSRPNYASCSTNPEDVFSSKYNKPRPSEHCKIQDPFERFQLDGEIKDLVINTDTKKVLWKVSFVGIARENLNNSIREAEKEGNLKQVEAIKSRFDRLKIGKLLYYHQIPHFYFGELLEEQYTKENIFLISSEFDNIIIRFSEASPKAYLTIFSTLASGVEKSTLMNIRFGACKLK